MAGTIGKALSRLLMIVDAQVGSPGAALGRPLARSERRRRDRPRNRERRYQTASGSRAPGGSRGGLTQGASRSMLRPSRRGGETRMAGKGADEQRIQRWLDWLRDGS